MLLECWALFFTFLKLGFISFGGGYAMLSMIMTEAQRFSITATQFADLNALDMVVPGAIAINAATYVGYLHMGMPGAIAATLGVSLPSFIYTVLVMRFFAHFENSKWLPDILSGIKPAAVGLVAAAAMTIASGVLFAEGKTMAQFWTDPLGSVSIPSVILFLATAVASIRFKVDPILLTVLAGVAGAVFLA